MAEPQIPLPRTALAAFCRRNGVRRLAFFGSVLRSDFDADSDVDVVVEFEADRVPGLGFFRLERELTALLGRSVDLHTPRFLSPLFRDDVMKEAHVEYDAA